MERKCLHEQRILYATIHVTRVLGRLLDIPTTVEVVLRCDHDRPNFMHSCLTLLDRIRAVLSAMLHLAARIIITTVSGRRGRLQQVTQQTDRGSVRDIQLTLKINCVDRITRVRQGNSLTAVILILSLINVSADAVRCLLQPHLQDVHRALRGCWFMSI